MPETLTTPLHARTGQSAVSGCHHASGHICSVGVDRTTGVHSSFHGGCMHQDGIAAAWIAIRSRGGG